MRRIRWAPAAADDLEGIRDYLRGHHPALVQSTVRRIYDAAKSLNYAPLPESVREKAIAKLGEITVNGKPAFTVP